MLERDTETGKGEERQTDGRENGYHNLTWAVKVTDATRMTNGVKRYLFGFVLLTKLAKVGRWMETPSTPLAPSCGHEAKKCGTCHWSESVQNKSLEIVYLLPTPPLSITVAE